MAYHHFKDDEGTEYGSFEVLYLDGEDDAEFPAGWYYQACFPGCLPDGEPMGPFETEDEAIEDAQGS